MGRRHRPRRRGGAGGFLSGAPAGRRRGVQQAGGGGGGGSRRRRGGGRPRSRLPARAILAQAVFHFHAPEASPPAPEPPMVVLCLRAAPPRLPTPTPHLAIGELKRDALCRLDAMAEHKQDEMACRAAAAGADGGGGAGEDRGHPPPHERLSSPPCREASLLSEPAPIAPMVVLCLRAATAPPLQASRRRGASDHAR